MNAESGVIVMFRRSMMLVAAVCLLLLGAPAPPFGVSQPTGESESPLDQLRSRIRLLAGTAMFLEAEALGVTVVEGKSLGVASAPSGSAGGRFGDVGIGVDPVIHENEPTVAANPADKKKLVAGSHFIDEAAGTVRCVAYTSADGGLTWSAPFTMPQLRRRSFCSDPVLAYAPDGTRVYYAYMDIKFQVSPRFVTSDLDIVVSFSDDNGATWTGPIVALDGDESIFDINTGELLDPGFDYDKPWIATHVDRTQKDWVYVTAHAIRQLRSLRVSHRVRRLERAGGVRLLERTQPPGRQLRRMCRAGGRPGISAERRSGR